MRSLTFICLLALCASGFANPTICSLGDATRKVEVVYSEPGQAVPCEVIYEKSVEGTIETLWRASNEAGYCESQAEGLVSKLGDLGWSCADAGGAGTDAEEMIGEEDAEDTSG